MNATPSLPLSAHELQQSMRQCRPQDAARLDRVLRLDEKRALVEVQANVSWKALAEHLRPGDARACELGTTASIGKTIARNAAGPDGRPAVAHVESLTLVIPGGQLRRVDRVASPALFALVVGGQGLFGLLYSATLRIESLARAVSEAQPIEEARAKGNLQLFVPPEDVDAFLADIAARCRDWRVAFEAAASRRIRPEDETLLRWARRHYAEVNIRLAEPATLGAAVRGTQLRRELIDAAIARGGSYPIAYTPEATRAQAEACYPQLAEFLAEQRRIDPGGLMANAWLRHQRSLLGRDTCEVRWGR